VTPVPANTVFITFNKLGRENGNWNGLKAGTSITLSCGKNRREVELRFRQDAESFHTFLELNAATARQLGLRELRRYAADYDERSRVLTLAPSPLSRASAAVRGGGASGAVQIGYALQSELGIPDRLGTAIHCRFGENRRKLIVRTPSNLFDRTFRLPSSLLRAFQLPEGKEVALRFDQNTQTLTLSSAAMPMNGAGANKQARPAQTNRRRQPANGTSYGPAQGLMSRRSAAPGRPLLHPALLPGKSRRPRRQPTRAGRRP